MFKFTWKIAVIGDSEVGKTSLVKRFVYEVFDGERHPSENKIYKKKIDISLNGKDAEINLLIFDITPSDENIEKYLMGANGLIVVGDITRMDSYSVMEKLCKSVVDALENHKSIMFVGNKSDLRYKAEFWEEDLKKLSDSYSGLYGVASPKTGENVMKIFNDIATHIFKTYLEKKGAR